jgi:integrase/recombinase XerC
MADAEPLRLIAVDEPAGPSPDRLDLLSLLLGSQRSPATRRAYELDLHDFFGDDPDVVRFLTGSRGDIVARLLAYKQQLLARKLSPATINRRLASVGALLRLAHSVERCVVDGRDLVRRERVRPYRNVRGVDLATMRKLLDAAAGEGVGGLRDRALFAIAFETGLRNGEIRALDVGDLDWTAGVLRVVGKGSGGQALFLDLPDALVGDLRRYLDAAGHSTGALFRSLDHRSGGTFRLTDSGLRYIVKAVGERIGVPLTVHKLRHSSITAARGVTGSLFEASDHSRHSDPRTLLLYDDDRGSAQGRVAQLISDRLRAEE